MLGDLNLSWENLYAAEIVRLVVALPAFDFASLNRAEAVEQVERRCRLLFEQDGAMDAFRHRLEALKDPAATGPRHQRVDHVYDALCDLLHHDGDPDDLLVRLLFGR